MISFFPSLSIHRSHLAALHSHSFLVASPQTQQGRNVWAHRERPVAGQTRTLRGLYWFHQFKIKLGAGITDSWMILLIHGWYYYNYSINFTQGPWFFSTKLRTLPSWSGCRTRQGFLWDGFGRGILDKQTGVVLRLLTGRCCPCGNMGGFSCFVGCICIDIYIYIYTYARYIAIYIQVWSFMLIPCSWLLFIKKQPWIWIGLVDVCCLSLVYPHF